MIYINIVTCSQNCHRLNDINVFITELLKIMSPLMCTVLANVNVRYLFFAKEKNKVMFFSFYCNIIQQYELNGTSLELIY